MTRRYIVAVLLLVLVLSGCAGEDEAPSGPDNDLATIELGHRPSATDETLIEVRSMLDTLEAVCTGNTRLQIADATAGVIKYLDEKEDVDVTPTQVMEDAITASDAWAAGNQSGDLDCRDLFALLVPLYASGQT
jgi:hypothetical protein